MSKSNDLIDSLVEEVTLTKDEAFAVAEFIDMNIFDAIRNDDDWDSFMALRSLVYAYEKCCKVSGYVGLTDKEEERKDALDP